MIPKVKRGALPDGLSHGDPVECRLNAEIRGTVEGVDGRGGIAVKLETPLYIDNMEHPIVTFFGWQLREWKR